jgi:hypothetical protein
MRFVSTIRAATGADGPFFVVTEMEGVVKNVTTGVATISAALNQARDDQGAVLVGSVYSVTISTVTDA